MHKDAKRCRTVAGARGTKHADRWNEVHLVRHAPTQQKRYVTHCKALKRDSNPGCCLQRTMLRVKGRQSSRAAVKRPVARARGEGVCVSGKRAQCRCRAVAGARGTKHAHR